MSKTMIWVVVGVAFVVGAAYFFMQNKAEDTGKANSVENLAGGTVLEGTEGNWSDTPTGENAPADTSGKKMAFGSLVAQGGSYECTVNQYVGETSSKGTVYTSGTLIRGKFDSQVNGLNITTDLIVRDGFTYTWTSMAPNMGFKAPVVSNTETNESTSTSGTYSWNANQIGDYDCKDWTPDVTKFDLPKEVAFKEIK